MVGYEEAWCGGVVGESSECIIKMIFVSYFMYIYIVWHKFWVSWIVVCQGCATGGSKGVDVGH